MSQAIPYAEADVTMFEQTAFVLPLGCAAAVNMANPNIDFFMLTSAPLSVLAGVGTFALARAAVNRNIPTDEHAEISDAENEANIRNSKVAAVAAGAAGIASKYELTKFFSSGNSKELLAGIALTGAAAFWAKISLEKHRNALGREKIQSI